MSPKFEIFPYTWRADQIHILVEERRSHDVNAYQGIRLSYLGSGFDCICLDLSPCASIGWPAQNVLKIEMFKHDRWWQIPNPYRRKI